MLIAVDYGYVFSDYDYIIAKIILSREKQKTEMLNDFYRVMYA